MTSLWSGYHSSLVAAGQRLAASWWWWLEGNVRRSLLLRPIRNYRESYYSLSQKLGLYNCLIQGAAGCLECLEILILSLDWTRIKINFEFNSIIIFDYVIIIDELYRLSHSFFLFIIIIYVSP